jgi:hypothetical protein
VEQAAPALTILTKLDQALLTAVAAVAARKLQVEQAAPAAVVLVAKIQAV